MGVRIPGRRVRHTAPSALVVDDSEDNAEMLAEVVGTYGYRVRVAHHGLDALVLLEDEPADLVVLDLCLPDIDGYQVAALIRKRFGDQVRIVALTGLTTQDVRDRALSEGFDAFIIKPATADDLQNALAGNVH
jgi:two-component system, OmpR family, response regulator